MVDFQTSSHKAKWIFTPQHLVEKYKATNQRAKQKLEKYGTTRMEVNADGSLSYPEPQVNTIDNADKHSHPKPLSVEEEQFMRVYYEYKLREVCSAFYFPHKIQATCKIEEIMYQQRNLSLEFDLIVYALNRPLEGFINDMEEFCHATEGQNQMLKDLQARIAAQVDKIMFTDAPLLFPPGRLALAALRSANEMHQVLNFQRYIRNMLTHQNPIHTISDLLESLDAIDSWVKKYKFPTEKDMKHVNWKLKSCWGHSPHDSSKKREKKSKHKSHKVSNGRQNGPSLA